jgi:predicted anti-sigma-YlaC factor YlaD
MLDWVVTAGCEETRTRLSEHLEGELSGWRRFRVLRHLARCEGCQAVLRSLATAVEHLQALGREPTPSFPSTADAVIGRIRRGVAEETP